MAAVVVVCCNYFLKIFSVLELIDCFRSFQDIFTNFLTFVFHIFFTDSNKYSKWTAALMVSQQSSSGQLLEIITPYHFGFFAAWGRSTPDYWPEVSSQADPLNFAFPPPQSQLQSHLNSDLQQSWFSTSALPPAAASGGAYCWQTRYPPTYPPGPGSGLSRDSSRDDLTSVEFDQVFDYEERFRVDRRKLELLMMGRFDPIKDMATDYFQRVSFALFEKK
jgi:hypothetical protein